MKNRLRHFSRRSFLRSCGALVGGALMSGRMSSLPGSASAATADTHDLFRGDRAPRRLIYIAIDALHPQYLELNSKGEPGGMDGDWLMPSVRAFLERAVWYPEAKA